MYNKIMQCKIWDIHLVVCSMIDNDFFVRLDQIFIGQLQNADLAFQIRSWLKAECDV